MDDLLLHHLAAVCRERRDAADLVRSAVAGRVNISEERIKRFETVAGKWPPYTGMIVASYAEATGTTAADIWMEALNRWRAAQLAEQSNSPRNKREAKALANQAEAATSQVRDSRSQVPRRAKGRQ